MKTIKREQIRLRMLWQAGAIVVLAITLGGLVNQIRPTSYPSFDAFFLDTKEP